MESGAGVALELLRGDWGQVKDVLCVVPPVTLTSILYSWVTVAWKGKTTIRFQSHLPRRCLNYTFPGMGEPAGGAGGPGTSVNFITFKCCWNVWGHEGGTPCSASEGERVVLVVCRCCFAHKG